MLISVAEYESLQVTLDLFSDDEALAESSALAGGLRGERHVRRGLGPTPLG